MPERGGDSVSPARALGNKSHRRCCSHPAKEVSTRIAKLVENRTHSDHWKSRKRQQRAVMSVLRRYSLLPRMSRDPSERRTVLGYQRAEVKRPLVGFSKTSHCAREKKSANGSEQRCERADGLGLRAQRKVTNRLETVRRSVPALLWVSCGTTQVSSVETLASENLTSQRDERSVCNPAFDQLPRSNPTWKTTYSKAIHLPHRSCENQASISLCQVNLGQDPCEGAPVRLEVERAHSLGADRVDASPRSMTVDLRRKEAGQSWNRSRTQHSA